MAKKQSNKPQKEALDEKFIESREHPVSEYLQQLVRDYGVKHADLVEGNRLEKFGVDAAYALGVDQSHVSRLLNLKENDRPSLGLLSRLFRLFSELASAKIREGHSPDSVAVTDTFESWSTFLSKRGDAVFYELVNRLGGKTDRPNPALSFLTKNDEIAWQWSHVPKERWIVTDILAEHIYDDFLEATCALIKHEKLRRLIYFMPNDEKAKKQYKHMRNDAIRKHLSSTNDFDEKVHCLLLKNFLPVMAPLLRMRLDEPVISGGSPLQSGVLSIGSEYDPLVVALPKESIGKIATWLQPHVRYMERVQSGYSDATENDEIIIYNPEE